MQRENKRHNQDLQQQAPILRGSAPAQAVGKFVQGLGGSCVLDWIVRRQFAHDKRRESLLRPQQGLFFFA
jgi:hypothetical protein